MVSGNIRVGLGFTSRYAYGSQRKRVVVFVNGWPEAEFVGTDDYSATGDILGVIKRPQSQEHYRPGDVLPLEYLGLNTITYRERIREQGAFRSLAIVTNIADFPTIIKHGLIQARWSGRS